MTTATLEKEIEDQLESQRKSPLVNEAGYYVYRAEKLSMEMVEAIDWLGDGFAGLGKLESEKQALRAIRDRAMELHSLLHIHSALADEDWNPKMVSYPAFLEQATREVMRERAEVKEKDLDKSPKGAKKSTNESTSYH